MEAARLLLGSDAKSCFSGHHGLTINIVVSEQALILQPGAWRADEFRAPRPVLKKLELLIARGNLS